MAKFVTRLRCVDCGKDWKEDQAVLEDLDMITCPECSVVMMLPKRSLEEQAKRLSEPPPAIRGNSSNASRAVDFTYKMAEQDYGMTDMKDNLRDGDTAYKMPIVTPDHNPVAQAINQRGGFFNNGAPQNVISQRSSSMDIAAAARAERHASGIADPVSVLQKSVKNTPSVIDMARSNPVGRAKLK